MRRETTPVLADLTTKTAKQLERVSLTKRTVDEGWLQALLFDNPTLLPVDELKLDAAPLIPIGREVPVRAGRIDCLYVSPAGQLTVVEVKLWSNPEARRQVVAQVIDYAKELSLWGYEDLDHCARSASGRGIWELVADGTVEVGLSEAQFVDEVTRNLKRGDFLLLLVGDGIREDVERMAEFLQGTPHLHFTLALIEIKLYRLPEQNALLVVPSVVMQTDEVVRAVVRVEQHNGHSSVSVTMAEPTLQGERSANHLLNEVDFLRKFEAASRNDAHSLELMKRLITSCENDPGLTIRWGNTSFTIALNLDSQKAGLPSALTVYETGMLKFHEDSFKKNIIRRGLPEEVGHKIREQHLDGLKRLAGENIPLGQMRGGEGPHLALLPGGFEGLLELLTSTARAVERELGIQRAV